MRRSWEAPLALIFCSLAELVVWHAAHGDLRISPDAMEYLGVARSLRQGHGMLLGVKCDFFNGLSPPYPAAARLPVLYPVMLAWSGLTPLHLNLLAAALTAFLVFDAARREAGAAVAWAALALVLLAPILWNTAVFAWPDAAYLFFLALAAGMLSRRRSPAAVLGVGAALGLATLTRDEGGIGILALAGVLLTEPGSAGAFARAAAAWALAAAPAAVLAVAATGWPPQTFHLAHFRVESLAEGIFTGYGRTFPSPWEFARGHARFILTHVAAMQIHGARELVLDHLHFLALGFAGMLLPRRGALPPALRWMLLAGLLQFAVEHAIWSTTTPYDPKYYLVPTVLLTAPLLQMAATLRLPRIGAAVLLAVIVGGALAAAPAGVKRLDERWRSMTLAGFNATWPADPSVAWLRAHALPDDVVACPDRHGHPRAADLSGSASCPPPWSVYLATGLPTVILPDVASPKEMRSYADTFHVKYFLDRPFPVSWLQPLPVPGVWRVEAETGGKRGADRPGAPDAPASR